MVLCLVTTPLTPHLSGVVRPLNCVDCPGRFGLDVPAAVPRTPGVGPQIKWWPVDLSGPTNDMIGP